MDQYSEEIPIVSLSILGLSGQPDFASLRNLVKTTRSACLFTLDSGGGKCFGLICGYGKGRESKEI
ncbi:MAG: hypothetical protein ACLFUU_11245 [Desulfobacteraceae bacterium]